MPITHRRAIRTTNLLERLFVEERWRLKIIPSACGEKAVLKLMFGAMIRAVKEELDHEYEVPNGLDAKASAPAPQNKKSSTFRT